MVTDPRWTQCGAVFMLLVLIRAAQAQPLGLDNGILRVDLEPRTGALTVTDRQTGMTYRQPDSSRDPLTCAAGAELRIPRSSAPPTLDGRVDDWAGAPVWRLDPSNKTSEKPWKIADNADLSAAVSFRWDDQRMYAVFVVVDDHFVPGTKEHKDWWEFDSAEWWAGWDQIGLPATPGEMAGFAWGDWKDWAHAFTREVADYGQEPAALALLTKAGLEGQGHGGWILESATDLAPLIQLHNPTVGRRFRFAFGVNDRDSAEGERKAQEYAPAGVVLGRRSTFAVGLLCDEKGGAPPAGALADDGRPPLCRDATRPDAETLTYTLTSDLPEATVGSVRCTVRLPKGSRDLGFTCSVLDGWEANIPIGRGFLPVDGPSEYLVPWYGNGVLIPTDDLKPPGDYFGVFDGLDMPGLGVVGPKGAALLLVDSYDNMECTLRPAFWDGRQVLGLLAILRQDRGKRLPEYRFTWHFAPEPSIVALARRMREFCDQQGWVRTLAEKRKINPNLERLYGAPDVWGAAGLSFAREAASAGIHHMLVNGRFPRADIEAMNSLGYLTGEYDQYVDTDDTTETVDGVKPLPACVRVEPNGELAKGWITLDKSHQWYSRCSETARRAAEAKIPGVLKDYPYNARFLDVHTAMGLVECYSKDHPCNRTRDRENKMGLLDYVRGLGLVLGGEHGRAWSVKGLDYQEGMMSCNPVFSWPAGWLVKVESADQISDAYLRYGIGYERRVPFWELVFHDCVVSTWYWGDSIGYLDRVRPDLTDRKVAFTALYGTVPLFWATDLDLGFRGAGKERFLEAYRNCSMIHEAVAEQRMRAHRYLSGDRALQETEFADGTRVVVNFAAEPREFELGGRRWTLASNGILADGPTVHEHVAVVRGHKQTSIVRPEWRFHDGHGTLREAGGIRSDGPVTVQSAGSDRLRISLEPRTKTASLDLREILGRSPGAVRVLALGPDLQPLRDLRVERDGDRVTLPCPGAWVAYECLVGAEAERPDAALSPEGTRAEGTPAQGAPLTLRVQMRNLGGGTAQRRLVARWGDGAEAAVAAVSIPPRRDVVRELPVDPGARDGARTLTLSLEGGEGERITSDNTLRVAVDLAPNWSCWTVRQDATVDLRGIARTDPVIECALPTTTAAEPSSLRVALLGPSGKPERLLPAQVLPPGVAGGSATLSFILPGEWRGDERVRVALLGAPPGAGFLPPEGGSLGPDRKSVSRTTYSASFGDGALRPVRFRAAEGAEIDALRQVVFSSPDTGWAEEKGGEIRSVEVLADGPVCTVARIVKLLPTDVTVTRTYSFYPRYIVAEASADKLCVGLFHRVWYSEKGAYADSAGHTAEADGSGKDEGIAGGCPNPRWFSLRSARWTHVCVALSPFDNQTYWDEGDAIGQCGFTSKSLQGNRVAHVLLGPGEPVGVEEAWHHALTTPPSVEWQK